VGRPVNCWGRSNYSEKAQSDLIEAVGQLPDGESTGARENWQQWGQCSCLEVSGSSFNTVKAGRLVTSHGGWGIQKPAFQRDNLECSSAKIVLEPKLGERNATRRLAGRNDGGNLALGGGLRPVDQTATPKQALPGVGAEREALQGTGIPLSKDAGRLRARLVRYRQ